SFVSRAYQAAGVPIAYPDTPDQIDGGPGQNTPGSRYELAAPWAVPQTVLTAKPGDLVFFPGADPPNGHVGMVLIAGLMVHTNRTGDVAHINPIDLGNVSGWAAVDPAKVVTTARADSQTLTTAAAAAADSVRARFDAATRDLKRVQHDLGTARADRAR